MQGSENEQPFLFNMPQAAGEVKALDTFFTMLQTEPDRAYYGYVHYFLLGYHAT